MDWYYAALLAGALGAGLAAWHVKNAALWLTLGGLSFAASSAWHEAGWPYGAAFGGITNLVICYLLYAFAKRRYEMRVWNAFHLMIVIELIQMLGLIPSQWLYAVSLEIANWLAILTIGAAGILERAGHGDRGSAVPGRAGWVYRLHRSLLGERKGRPFWTVP